MQWSFFQIWNESLEQREEKELKPRTNMWAGELGGAYVDRWLKMKAVSPSNPFDPRSLRKFEAGNIWEWIVSMVLKRAGILIDKGEWCGFQYPGLLKVTGKLDFVAGGKPDYDKAMFEITHLRLPQFIEKATANIISHFKEKYPDGLNEIILELKSCSAFMFDIYEGKNEANKNHKLQLFHYLKAKQYPEGHVVYICKDDARMLEVGIMNPSPLEDEYKKDIEDMTKYVMDDEQPPLEKFIVYNEEFDKFSANYKVGYSNYISKLYGYKNQSDFDEKYKPIVERWNRVLGRVREGKTMTANNIQAKDEISKEFPDFKFKG